MNSSDQQSNILFTHIKAENKHAKTSMICQKLGKSEREKKGVYHVRVRNETINDNMKGNYP